MSGPAGRDRSAGLRSGGSAVARALADHGVDVVWGIPGTHNLEIYAHLTAAGIRHVLPRHEQGAAFAADGYARATGRVGVCVTTSGPAVLNAATALGQAWSDSVPVLLVSAGMPLRHPGRGNGYLHETKDLHAALEGVVAYSHRVTSVPEIPVAITQAFATMTAGRARPVHIEVPLDVLVETGESMTVTPVAASTSIPHPTAVRRAAQLLSDAERVIVVAGGGAVDAPDALRRVAERLGAPVVTTFNGKGTIATDHPLVLGTGLHRPSMRALVEECDAVLVVGSELSPADLWEGPLPFDGRVVRVDVDPAQAVANAVPAAALVGDARATLEALLGAWDHTASVRAPDADDWVAGWHARFAAETRHETARWEWVLDPIAAALGRDGILAGDSAMVCYYGAALRLPAHRPRTFLYPTGYGTLGYGLPAGIGAALGRPDVPVIVLMGDGGIMFTAAELAAAAQLRIPLPIVVVDNGGYGEIQAEMLHRGDAPLAVELPSPDFPGLAIALGCAGEFVPDADALTSALRRALAADRPTLIHVRAP